MKNLVIGQSGGPDRRHQCKSSTEQSKHLRNPARTGVMNLE
ncbi:MAG: hypothetical protein ACLUAR_17005 [Pilosibacter sp.]